MKVLFWFLVVLGLLALLAGGGGIALGILALGSFGLMASRA
jgi:hypothetical protein